MNPPQDMTCQHMEWNLAAGKKNYFETVAKEMRDRHPPPRAEDVARRKLLPIDPPSLAPSLTVLQEALLSFAPGLSSGTVGPSPTTYQRRAAPRLQGRGGAFRAHDSRDNGRRRPLSGPVVSWMARGSLTALKRKDGGHRPVAVGETLLHLTAKALLATVSEDVTRYLRPTQLGLGTKNCWEPTVHTIKRWLRKHDNDDKRSILTMDFENGRRPDRPVNPTNGAGPGCCSNDIFSLLDP